jgi:hypothetical protein
MQAITDRLVKNEEINIGSGRHLWEIKENFTKLCNSFATLDLIAAGVSGQSLLLETLVEALRHAQRSLEAMQRDIHQQVSDEG